MSLVESLAESLALTRDAEVLRVAVVPAAGLALVLLVLGSSVRARGGRGGPLLALAGVVAVVSVTALVLYLPVSA